MAMSIPGDANPGDGGARPGGRWTVRGSADLRRLLALARPQAGPLALALAALALYSALGLAVPALIGGLLDRVLAAGGATAAPLPGAIPAAGPAGLAMPGGLAALVAWLSSSGRTGLDRLALTLGLVFLGRGALLGLHVWLLARVGGRLVMDLRERVFARLLALGPAFHDRHPSGNLVSRLLSDTAALQGALTTDLAALLSNALLLSGGGAILLWQNRRLSLVLLALVPPLVLLSWAYGRRMRASGQAVQTRTAAASAQAQESLGALRLIQLFVQEAGEAHRFRSASLALYEAVMARVRLSAAFGGLVNLLGFGALALMLWLGGREVLAGRLGAGALIGTLIYAQMVASAAGGLIGLWGRAAAALGAAAWVFGILEGRPEEVEARAAVEAEEVRPPQVNPISAATRGGPAPDGRSIRPLPASPAAAGSAAVGPRPPRGLRLRAEGLTFGYRPGRPVLAGVDLEVAPGEFLALVGASGAGKSTLCLLLAGFYAPWEGRVLVDGEDLRGLDPAAYRRRLGMVPQDTLLFDRTVAENLRLGRPDADLAALEAAARAAQAHDFIVALPEGYDTPLGEGGGRLSLGQRQRLTIARALLRDPDLLLLDEATSALDIENEARVQEALAALTAGRTTVAIAHRLSTLGRADRVAVLEGGRLVQLGSHAELLATDGPYARLCARQLLIGG